MNATEVKRFYDEKGFVAVNGFLSKNQVIELIAQTDRFVNEIVPGISPEAVYYEYKGDTSTLKQIQQIHVYDPYFKNLAYSEKITGLAELLLGGKAVLKNMQYFNKIPHHGKETPAHQDGYYFMIKPQEAITMWLSMEEADAENGAVCYIPSSHRKGMRDHGKTSLVGFSQGITDWSDKDTKSEVQMKASAGDILVHHSLTIHRANANKSFRHRRAIGFIFYRNDVVIDEDAHAAYKKKLDADLKEQGKI
jgi:phytanoyl-CoA hydroxylase